MAKAVKQQYSDIIKMYHSMLGEHQMWELWQDSMVMFGCAISNSVDNRFRKEREEQYLRIIGKYTPEEAKKFPKIFCEIINQIEKEPEQDFLGDLYMTLELGSHWHGQFFTPYHICEMMAQVIMGGEDDHVRQEVKKRGYVSLCDPCVGGGVMMIGGAQALYKMGVNYQQEAVFACQDIDYTVAMMAYIQLSLLGCPGYVVVGNSLTEPMTGHVLFGEETERTFCTPMFFSEKFNLLRQAEIMRRLFATVGMTGRDDTETVETPATMGEEPPGEAETKAAEAEAPSDPASEEPRVIEVSRKKGKTLAGQIMFDFS